MRLKTMFAAFAAISSVALTSTAASAMPNGIPRADALVGQGSNLEQVRVVRGNRTVVRRVGPRRFAARRVWRPGLRRSFAWGAGPAWGPRPGFSVGWGAGPAWGPRPAFSVGWGPDPFWSPGPFWGPGPGWSTAWNRGWGW